MEQHGKLMCVIAAGLTLRVAIYSLDGVLQTLSRRPELVTAVSSFDRVREGAFLFDHTGSPYTGEVFHQPPLVFALFYPFLHFITSPERQYMAVCGIFLLIDLLIALGFARLCRRTLVMEEGRIPYDNQTKQEIWLHKTPVSPLFTSSNLPAMVAFVYLLNPYSLGSSCALSTVSLTHLAVLYSLVFASEGAVAASMLCAAIGTYLSIYPALLLVPIVLLLQSAKVTLGTSKSLQVHTMVALTFFAIWLGGLLYLSKELSGGWEFLNETYFWIAKYSDLTPNVGIFWYFFMEVFDRFIPYFLFVLHIHPCIYVVPIYMRLKHRPQAYACALVGILTLFQAYPTIGDFGFFLTTMCLHPKSIMTIENRFVYALGLGVATCLLPVMWFLWLFPASGNANFFYNQTIVYQIFNSQIINAFVGATMKRDKVLQTYWKRMHQSDRVKSEATKSGE